MRTYILMVNKIILILIMIFFSGEKLVAKEFDLVIKNNTASSENISIIMVVSNCSDETIELPKSYFQLFWDKEKTVVGDWLLVKNGNKTLSHKTVFVKLKADGLSDGELVKIAAGEQYFVQYDNIQKYFRIPFWIRKIYVQYKGLLGESNIIEIKL